MTRRDSAPDGAAVVPSTSPSTGMRCSSRRRDTDADHDRLAATLTAYGYPKIGLTNPAMRRMCGIDEPIVGQILSNQIHQSPSSIELNSFVRLGIESEFAIHLTRPVPPLPASEDPRELLQYIDVVAATFEFVEDRNADYATLDAYSIIAENSWNKGVVTGVPLSVRGLGDLTGLLSINGQPAGEGSSSDVMGGPLDVLAWVEPLCRGRRLRVASLPMGRDGRDHPDQVLRGWRPVRFALGGSRRSSLASDKVPPRPPARHGGQAR